MKAEKPHGPQILLVDDNPTNLQVLYQTLDGLGYRLLAAKSGKDALSIAERVAPDLIMLDVMMPGMDGFETCARLKGNARTRDSAVIFLSALTEASDKVRGLELGAVDFVNKPFQAEEVIARVRTHLTIRDLQRRLRLRNEELEHELTVAQELLREARQRTDGVLLGDSIAVQQLRREIDEAASSDQTIVISGPPGSDHEAVARAIHHQSPRGSRGFICVNCLSVSDYTPTSVETGSVTDVRIKVRLAEGGTLYMEGIQHLRQEWQRVLVELLRSLEARGSGAPPPDVRVIMSATRDIDEEVAAGNILPELRRALRRTVDIVPLRSRIEDLPVLASHFLQRQAEQAGRTAPMISEQSLERMKSYRWPGNLGELRSVLECALATNDGPVLEVGEQLLDGGQRVGSYRLLERIGSGGMGEVWLAQHQLLRRPAAVKLVRQATAGSTEDAPALRQRFAREAQATAELQSPHTVQLYDFGVTDTGSFYYVMERLRGMDLQRMIERYGPLSPDRAVFLLKQVCRSLAEAHALGLVHRDVKPANLFVCRLGSEFDFLKVLDFGVVSAADVRETIAPITKAGMLLGTPAFLAPEFISGEVFDGRADIYSIGCVAFWLLTGRPPFEGRDVVSVLMHHSGTKPSPPSTCTEQAIPPDLDAAVMACLSKDPAQRPESAERLWRLFDATGLADRWDQNRARTWWELHEPEFLTQN